MSNTIKLTEPANLIAALPAILGFVPNESFIPVALNSNGVVHLTMRLDINCPEAGFLHIQELLENDPEVHALVLVSVGPRPDWDLNLTKVMLMVPEKVQKFLLLAVPRIAPGLPVLVFDGKTWYYEGVLPDWKDQEITATTVMQGNVVSTSEQDIVTMFLEGADPDQVTNYPGTCVITWVDSGFEDGLRPPNHVIGEFLADNVKKRDYILPRMLDNLDKAFSEFTVVSRNTSGRPRQEALTIAGMAAYCGGKGAHARVAFHLAQVEAEERGEDAVLATLAATMLGNGVHPSEIKRVCQKAG